MRLSEASEVGALGLSGFGSLGQLGWGEVNLGRIRRAEGVWAQREKLEGSWKDQRLRYAGFLIFNASLSIFSIVLKPSFRGGYSMMRLL